MNILNLGNCIKNGNYKLHSKFKNVHNYTNDDELVSLVSSKIGNGPNNIVLNNLPLQAEQTLSVTKTTISIGNNALHFDPIGLHYKENIYINNSFELLSGIDLIIDEITDKLSPQSLGFLLFKKNEIFFQTTFERAFLSRTKQIMQDFNFENLPQIAKSIKGLGFGLTPSGDDFNCGVLYALNYLNEISDQDLSKLINKYYTNSIGTNLISNTFLKFAYSNKYYENFYELLKALKHNIRQEISNYTNKIVGSGHTSGSDMLTGFIVTIKGVLNDKKFS